MNDGQLEDLIDYLHSFQVDQSFELGTIETSINSSLLRLENSALQVENEIVNQKLLIEKIKAGPAKLPILEEAVAKISALLEKESGIDSDEDGLYDSVEIEISEYSVTIADVVGLSILNLNPEEEESTPSRKDASLAKG